MSNALQRAISDYHHLIEVDLQRSEAQLDQLVALQHERKVLFGDRHMANSLRPTLMTEATYTAVQDTVYLIRQAILQIAARCFDNEHVLRHDLGMEDWEIELASIPRTSSACRRLLGWTHS